MATFQQVRSVHVVNSFASEPGDLQFILCVPMFCTLICVCAVLDCLCGCGYHQKYADCICVLCSQAPELQLINAVKAGEYGTVYSFIKQNDRATIDRADEVSICDPNLFQIFNVGVRFLSTGRSHCYALGSSRRSMQDSPTVDQARM
jgi:hypothetical protein